MSKLILVFLFYFESRNMIGIEMVANVKNVDAHPKLKKIAKDNRLNDG